MVSPTNANGRIVINTVPGGSGVHLYCTGDVSTTASGGIVNNSGEVSTFCLYGTAESGGTIKLTGALELVGVIYAPSYDCSVDGTCLPNGSINVDSFRCVGSSIMNYDDSLAGNELDVFLSMLSWREEKI